MAPQTSIQTLIPVTTVYTWTSNNLVSETTIIFSPQTTPYTPKDTLLHNHYKPSIYCPVTAEALTPGYVCLYWDWVTTDHNVPFRTDCYPDGYAELYLPGPTWDDLSTLAFPGTACPSRWTPACTVTMAASDGQKHTQIWCCPESDFACATEGGPYAPGTRVCTSLLSTLTEVWVKRHTMTGSSLFERLTIQSTHANAATPIQVVRNVFPLQTDSPYINISETSSGSPASNSNSTGDDHPLSRDAKIGIIVGTVIPGLSLIVGLLMWMLPRFWRSRSQRSSTGS